MQSRSVELSAGEREVTLSLRWQWELNGELTYRLRRTQQRGNMIDVRVCFWCARMCASHQSRRFNYSACIKSSFLQPSEPAHLMVNTNEYYIFTTKPRVRGKKTDAESLREGKKKMTAVRGRWLTLPSELKEGEDKQKSEGREEWEDGVSLRIGVVRRRRGERHSLSQDQLTVSVMSGLSPRCFTLVACIDFFFSF